MSTPRFHTPWTKPTVLALLLGAAMLPAMGAAQQPPNAAFPLDFVFEVSSPSADPTHKSETFVAHSNSYGIRADLEDYDLVSGQYSVRVVMKPPGCTNPGDWVDAGWSVPDYTNSLAPVEWPAQCNPSGLWTIEITAEASALSAGGLRVHVSEY